MKIGIDIDEVIKDTLNSVLNFYYERTGKRYSREDFKVYNWWEIWNMTKEEALQIWYEFVRSELYNKIPMIEGSKEAIELLDKKHDIMFITSRSDSLENETREWFEIHFPGKKFRISFTSYVEGGLTGKSDVCENNGIGILIEDQAIHSKECADKGIKVILFDKPWNQGVEHENIIRVNGWSEALREIEKLQV